MGFISRLVCLKRQGECGQSLVIFIFGLAALLGFAALTIDVGSAWLARRDMQNAADAAAIAGADRMLDGGLIPEAESVAYDMALQNGYDDAASDANVTVNIPPLPALTAAA